MNKFFTLIFYGIKLPPNLLILKNSLDNHDHHNKKTQMICKLFFYKAENYKINTLLTVYHMSLWIKPSTEERLEVKKK